MTQCAFNGKMVLILNADYRPISYYPLSIQSMKKVIKALVKNKLNILEEYDETVNISGTTIRLPKVAILKRYVHTMQTPKFSRYNVYLRDKFTCQYCGRKFPHSELTFDHVVPRMQNGKTTWNNIVTACKHCNTEKGCRDVDGRRFKLLSKPHIPTNAELLRNLKELGAGVSYDMKNWEQWLSNI